VLAQLEAQFDRQTYETWIKSTQLLVLDHAGAVLGTPNVFVRDEVRQHYAAQIAAALSTSYGRAVELDVVIGTAL
jgi:chromosomal replication initiation ATPase DnaA